MQRKHILILIFAFFLTPCGATQSYVIKNLNTEHGLSNNYVKNIIQDGQGLIWFATETGLNRFDGQAFTSYTVGSSGLYNDAINTLLYDPYDNLLWIGTKSILAMLNLNNYQFSNYEGEKDAPLHNIVDMSFAGDSGIWITNHHDGIVYYNKRTKQFKHYSDKNIRGLNNSNWCAFDDGKGNLYIGHAQGGLSILNVSNNAIRHFRHNPDNPHSLPGNSVYTICIDHQQNIWVGTNQGLALFNPQQDTFQVFKHNPNNPYSIIADHIYDIKEMDDGTLWIGSDIGGVSILDLYNTGFVDSETVKFKNLTPTSEGNALSSGNIRNLLQDSYGNIWIGNYSSGVDFISHTPPSFRILPYTMTQANRYKNKSVWGIYADKQGQVWLGSENEVAIFRDNKLQRTIDISRYQSRPYTQVSSIKENSQGIILLGLFDDGLLKLDPQTNEIQRIDLKMDYIDVITFYEDSDKTMWIGTEYGVYTYRDETIRFEEGISQQLHDKSIFGILHDNQGKLWMGSSGGGIFIFDVEHKLVEQLDKLTGLRANSINQLHLDKEGGVWIASRDGIGYIKNTEQPKSCEWYSVAQGLTGPYVRAIQEDTLGNIWISTNQGISLWDKQKKKFNNYNRIDGLPSGNFTEGSTYLTTNGTIYFGSLNGVCYFNPQDVILTQPIAPVQIIDCRGFYKQVEKSNMEYPISFEKGNIELNSNQNSISISFSVPDYSQNGQVEYAYRIEGLEENWLNTSGENHVTFRNLSPGKYIFNVKARLKNQEWDEAHIASLEILIHPPLWLTWYAKLFYLITIGIVIFFFIKSYKRKLELKSSLEIEQRNIQNEQNLNQERLRFYTNITHELRTPLTLILGPLEDLVNDRNLPVAYRKVIGTIHGSALRLLNLINQILEFRKTETQNRKLTVAKGNLAELITEIGLRYKELNRNPEVSFHIRIETEQVQLYFDPDVITTILNNLLSNAMKYTPKGTIELSLRSVQDEGSNYTEISVTDTGRGIVPEALPHIFDRYYQAKDKYQASGTGIGLALVKSLVELHEGKLYVNSVSGEGSSFTLRLLSTHAYPTALHEDSEDLSKPEAELHTQTTKGNTYTKSVILVVEDNEDIREYIHSSLNSEYKVICASNGKEGLNKILTTIPDLIISDIMMPEMDGTELCRLTKDDIRTSHIPIILLTAKDSIKDKEEGYESGADSYLTKPFSASLLRSRIRNLLEIRKKLAKQIAASTQNRLHDTPQPQLKMSKLDEKFLIRLTKLVENNLDDEKLDIAFMTQQMNMSQSTFYRKVKGLTGISPNEFIRKIRLKHSAQLLLSGNYNISEVAFMTGFNHLGHFRMCFKEEYGVIPSEYLKQQKGG